MMKKNGYGIYIAAAVFVLVIGGLFIMGTIRHSNDDQAEPASSSESSQETNNDEATDETAVSGMPGSVVDTDSSDNENQTDASDTASTINTDGLDTATNIPTGYESEFTEFSVSTPQAQDNNGYAERIEPITGRTNYDLKKEKLDGMNLEPVLNDAGYPVKVFNGQYTLYQATDEEGNTKQYIVSGVDLVEYTGNNHTFDSLVVARQEETGTRIHIFQSQDEVDAFLAAREAGAQALNESNVNGDWKIVLNGQLVEGASPMMGEDGQLYLPLRQLAETYNPHFTQFDGGAGLLYIGIDGCLFAIPCDEASSYTKSKLEFFTDADGIERYRYSDMGMGGNIVNVTGTPMVPMTAQYMWSTPDDLALMLGWNVSIKGHTINVESDPLDNSDLYILFDTVSSGVVEGS